MIFYLQDIKSINRSCNSNKFNQNQYKKSIHLTKIQITILKTHKIYLFKALIKYQQKKLQNSKQIKILKKINKINKNKLTKK